MYEIVEKDILKYKLIEPGDVVLTAVSGGADSVCLLHLLNSMKEKMAFTLEAAHVEHGVRGDESLSDAIFVQNLCEDLKIPLSLRHVDAPGYAKEHGLTLEEACRELRYTFFYETADVLSKNYSGKRVRIAVAHNQNDQAETVLLHMLRGSDIRGAGGMEYASDAVIRPLLSVSRAQIETYLKQNHIVWRTDATNADTIYARNRIRHRILPEMEAVNADAVSHLSDFSARAREIEHYLEKQTQKAMRGCVKLIGSEKLTESGKLIENGKPIENGKLLQECINPEKKELTASGDAHQGAMALLLCEAPYRDADELIQGRLIYECITLCAGKKKDITATHVRLCAQLAEKSVGRTLDLPYGVKAERTYEGILFFHESYDKMSLKKSRHQSGIEEKSENGNSKESLVEAKSGNPNGSLTEAKKGNPKESSATTETHGFEMRKFIYETGMPIPKKKYTKWFDYDKIKYRVECRNRQIGDYLCVDESGNRQKLKKYLINEKIPASVRDSLPLFCDKDHVMWVVGHRISAYYKVTENTKNILEIKYNGGVEE